MWPGLQIRILISEVNTFSVEIIVDAGSLRLAVASRAEPVKANDVIVSQPVFIARWKFAIDSVPDLVSSAEDSYGLFDQQGPIIEQSNVAMEIADAFSLRAS